ncbi:MAG: MBL fold metallo-hydrolase [Kiritimatiellae bacterium]|nr:MBL fold metallo-hydrolase [Kiritimatiellia bacterium]
MESTRREFIVSAAGAAAFAARARAAQDAARPSLVTAAEGAILDKWQDETELVTNDVYNSYWRDGDARGFASLENLSAAFDKVLREARETVVAGDRPAVWSVYNMGYVVKTRETMFSIDLVHRRAAELAPQLDFALITHNHDDHWREGLYRAMDGAGKTVVSNFLDNYGVRNWRKDGGYVRGTKTFRFKDVEVRTSLIDHNDYLIDFTTAFEIRVGGFLLYHTGDSGKGTEPKLGTVWGRPDLWLFFPGCGVDVAKAVQRVGAKRIVFGHLWELGHRNGHRGRLDAPLVRRALERARPHCADVSFALWGDRVV